MIVELYNSRHGYSAVVQAIARVQLRTRAYGRGLLEGVVRELIEHELHQALSDLTEEQFAGKLPDKAAELETVARFELDRRNINLESLEVRLVRMDSPPQMGPPGTYRWIEFLSPEIGTGDGFQVAVDVVALVVPARADSRLESNFAARLARQGVVDGLVSHLGGLLLEDVLIGRRRWTQQAAEDAERHLARAGLELRYLAVTEVRARPGKKAFRPAAPRNGDPLLGLHFLRPYADALKDPLPEDESRG
ncbi:MAG: hypothetical protein HY319_12815 [Armatimonadetes bacterium]|nr:hypothetical protein [Armatimonadota bacterium]